ncbi:hypothetical protein BD769DRAFT_1441049 [Suillus cothurnatus]|nr:hypothetical protein BD769DRAFT_1441049 [Suillus cothurnatus]
MFIVDSTLAADFDGIFNTNTYGTFLYLRTAVEAMIKRGRGRRIIAVSSVTGSKGSASTGFDGALKGAIQSFTRHSHCYTFSSQVSR